MAGDGEVALRAFVLGLSFVTLGHLGFRMATMGFGRAELTPVSPLTAGDTVPALFFEELGAALLSTDVSQCQTVVVFHPSCPVARRAVERRDESGLASGVPVLWITKEDEEGVQAFRDRLPAGDQSLINKRAVAALHVRAVPAAFLLASDSTLKRVWPLTGRETPQDIAEWCAAEAPHPSMIGGS